MRRRVHLLLLTALGALACAGERAPDPAGEGDLPHPCEAPPCTVASAAPAPTLAFGEVFTTVGRVTLEEPPDARIASPIVSADPEGGLLMVDVQERQYLCFDGTGRLLWSVGPLSGLHTFREANQIARLSPTRVFLGQANGAVAVWDEERREVQRSFHLARGGLGERPAALDTGTVLFHLPLSGGDAPALATFSLSGGTMVDSFFAPPVTPLTQAAVEAGAGRTFSAVRGDTIATVFTFSDTIYLHHRDGRLLERIAFPTPYFTAPPAPFSAAGGTLAEWQGGAAAATKLFWLEGGTFVVEYRRVSPESGGREPAFLGVRRNGQGIFEVHGFGGLLQAVDRHGNFYFTDPALPTANVLLVARLGPAG